MENEGEQPEEDRGGVEEAGETRRRRRRTVRRERAERSERDSDDEERLSERLTQQFAHQWALIRAERRAERTEVRPIETGPSNLRRAEVPWGVDLAAAWAWRFIVIAVALVAVLWVMRFFAVITLPLMVALLIAALANPGVRGLKRIGIPQAVSALLITITGLGMIIALVTFVGREIIRGGTELADQVVDGLGKIRVWLKDGPLNASDSQINGWIEEAQKAITERTQDPEVVTQVTQFGTALTHIVAGIFIILFATYFFLADGQRIWAWVVRMFPRAAREKVDSSGKVAWVSLTQFVRATVIVALVDAIGIMIVAYLLDVPLVLPIGVLVFLGAFVPMIGATVAGSVAVLVALVAHGPVTALLMLGGVILVQQVEGHILQPFLMGRFVSVHPLGVIVAIGCGVLVAGVGGALIAVPLAAVVNAVSQHLASFTEVGESPPEQALKDDIGPRPDDPEQLADAHDEPVGPAGTSSPGAASDASTTPGPRGAGDA
ncbi:AI-2E family transporter [Nocardioides sp. AE5]|uniref:AI-2E family transporter n=1 Tax=Nocardioides sp. AE5 TaxID=2962573 RepID=UPI00288102D4|nr:AI-2E family transporter [Nocardioides sp. AE5]MDT0202260.1 AI-2E family transporter [Nocardioides sp. AE5]